MTVSRGLNSMINALRFVHAGISCGRGKQISVPIAASYEVDLWGQIRRSIESANALTQVSVAQYENVLLGLKSEGIEPTLILWALVRELRGLWQARERDRLRSTDRGSGWHLAATPSPRALARLKTLPLPRLLRQAGHTDRVIKGLAMGDAWSALTGLTGSLAGALQASPESGRVPP